MDRRTVASQERIRESMASREDDEEKAAARQDSPVTPENTPRPHSIREADRIEQTVLELSGVLYRQMRDAQDRYVIQHVCG